MKGLAQFIAFVIGTFIAISLRSSDGSITTGDLLFGVVVGGGIATSLAGAFFKDESTSQTQATPTLGSLIAPQDHIPKLKKLKEMHDTGLITAQDYDTQKAEILSRLASEPTRISVPIPVPILQLTTDLQQGNERQRRAAAYKLGKFKDSAAVTALISAFNDTDSSVRQNVIDGLRAIGTPEAVEFLNSHNLQSAQGKSDKEKYLQLAMFIVVLMVVLIIGTILAIATSS